MSRLLQRAMQRYFRLRRSLTLGARGIVLEPATGRILLVRHTYAPGWTFPGGGVEFGDTLLGALRRELAEEVNVTVQGEPELFGIYSNAEIFPGDHVAIYVVRDWTQSHPPGPNREIAETGFFAQDALPDGVSGGVRRRLDEMAGLRPRIETW